MVGISWGRGDANKTLEQEYYKRYFYSWGLLSRWVLLGEF